MCNSFLVLGILMLACLALGRPNTDVIYPAYESDGSDVPREAISGPGNGYHGDAFGALDERVHPTTCLLCCKSKSPKFNTTLCKNSKVCNTKTCLRYMSKQRGAPIRDPNPALSSRRGGRAQEILIPQDQAPDICRRMHPEYRSVSMQPGPSESCSFFCVSEHNPLLASHKTPNGWECAGNQKVCWDGVCQKKTGREEQEICRSRIYKSESVTADGIQAVVKLPCYLVCKASVNGVVWYVPRTDNDGCSAPDWLPRDMGLDMKENY